MDNKATLYSYLIVAYLLFEGWVPLLRYQDIEK